MSIHTSLRAKASETGSLRNVLKRHERVRQLMTTGRWAEGQSVFGLPKLKQVRMKARKAAAKEKEEAAAATGTTPAAPAAPAK